MKNKLTAFGKWYSKFYRNYDSESYFSGEAGWEACKKECLKILSKNIETNHSLLTIQKIKSL